MKKLYHNIIMGAKTELKHKVIFLIMYELVKKQYLLCLLISLTTLLFADPFNKKLTDEERIQLNDGKVLIKNINFDRNICLNQNINAYADELLKTIDDLNPKYLAEIIQFRPYKENEAFDDVLHDLLYNVPDYAGIPYYSERAEKWYDLYEWAKITDEKKDGNTTLLKCQMLMDPFDIVDETITIKKDKDMVLYVAQNENLLRYLDKFDCVWPKKMKIAILLFRDGDKWIFYGIGGVNAPRIPFFTERIQTSFINRINTFCSFIFNKFDEELN